MRIDIPVTESSFRQKLQNRFTPQRNAYSHANGIPIPIRPESLFTSQRNVYSHRPEYPEMGWSGFPPGKSHSLGRFQRK